MLIEAIEENKQIESRSRTLLSEMHQRTENVADILQFITSFLGPEPEPDQDRSG